tara:strand:+ start:6549 stop:7388 length:840 start_codon:yes stop_codon:yes gene_type:complete
MAKNKKTKVESTPQVEEPKVETVVMEAPKPKIKKDPSSEEGWVIKDRLYKLKGKNKPISFSVPSSNLRWFDEEAGYQRSIQYSKNQTTVFVEDMKGDIHREHIVFRNGNLFVPGEEVILQKFLSIYHPKLDNLYYEVKPEVEAEQTLDYLEWELAALNLAQHMDIDHAEAILRVQMGSVASKMSSKEIKRDLILLARRNPQLFVELAKDDNVILRNFGIKATEEGVITLSQDQRTFSWTSTGRKLMTVPFDENPYSALAAWFKTDEGVDVYRTIEKHLK